VKEFYIYHSKTNFIMTTQNSSSKAWNISLWIAQIILAAMFLMVGIMKLTQPIEKLLASLPALKDVSPALIRFIGFSEFLGAVGLILPSLLRIKPKLTVWAAIGIIVIMLLAILFHISHGQVSAIGMIIVIGLIAAFVAWGRTKKAPISSK
jgi:uncharacterized membrane protein YphA (DoxX/SURF4 family)